MGEAQFPLARLHPHEGPVLAAWGGHYDHAFIALHPFLRCEPEPWRDPVNWAQIAWAIGSPSFPDFALAVVLAANGMSGKQRADADQDLIRRLDSVVKERKLEYPEDGYLPASLCPSFAQLFAMLGSDVVITRDQHSNDEKEISLAELSENPFAVPRFTGALIDVEERMIVTCFPMDTYHSIVGVQSDALMTFGNDLRLEGFYAGPETADRWVNEPGTYAYPTWLEANVA